MSLTPESTNSDGAAGGEAERSLGETKLAYERVFKLISFFSLLRQCQANDLDFARLLQQLTSPRPSRLPALLKQMRALYQLSSLSFFAWYLKSRIQAQTKNTQNLSTVTALLKAAKNESVVPKQLALTQG